MLIFPLLLIAAQPAAAPTPYSPTLREVEAMTPAAAGEMLLRSWQHGPIVAGRRRDYFRPALTHYELFEAPRAVQGGCIRRRWTTRFELRPDRSSADVADRGFIDAWVVDQVALRDGRRCPDTGYAILFGYVGAAAAFDHLRRLRRIARGRIRVTFTCASDFDPRVCASDATIRAALRARRPWAVWPGSVYIGDPENPVMTSVQFPMDQSDHVVVREGVPPPS